MSKVTAFVTKWGLTKGIVRMSGELVDEGKYFSGKGVFAQKKDYAMTLEEAEQQVKDKATAKIESLKRQELKMQKILLFGCRRR